MKCSTVIVAVIVVTESNKSGATPIKRQLPEMSKMVKRLMTTASSTRMIMIMMRMIVTRRLANKTV